MRSHTHDNDLESLAEDALDIYLALGEERTLATLHDQLAVDWPTAPSLTMLERWSREYGWEPAAEDHDARAHTEELRRMLIERASIARARSAERRTFENAVQAIVLSALVADAPLWGAREYVSSQIHDDSVPSPRQLRLRNLAGDDIQVICRLLAAVSRSAPLETDPSVGGEMVSPVEEERRTTPSLEATAELYGHIDAFVKALQATIAETQADSGPDGTDDRDPWGY